MMIKKLSMAVLLVLAVTTAFAQSGITKEGGQPPATDKISEPKPIVITGVRFSYKILQKWIDNYRQVAPEVKIIIEPRGSVDPGHYDILAEIFEHDPSIKNKREYTYVGRYAILPVANSASAFARVYQEKGLTRNLINHLFFQDIFSAKESEQLSATPFTVYTRLQKAGAPAVFAQYFGHEQKDIRGISVAGSDAHLLKALLSDSTGLTYLPLPLIFDENTGKPLSGLTVLPVDLNGNKKISEDERFYHSIESVIERLEQETGKINNVPVAYLHLSIARRHANPEAQNFLNWVSAHGEQDLHAFGYLKPEGHYRKLSTAKESISGAHGNE